MLALLERPGREGRPRRQHRRRRRCGRSATEEFLRWGASIHNFRRTATRDTEIAGQPIKAGRQGRHLLRRGQPRPDHFADPNVFDTRRTPNDHLTFGGGGAALLPRRQPRPGADQDHDARVPAPLPERRGRRRAPPHALRLRQRHQVPAGAPQRLTVSPRPGRVAPTRPSRSATVTVNAEWPFRRMGEGTGSRK